MKWILLAMLSQQSVAALPVILPDAISFYKTQKSQFTSGQAALSDLEKTLIRTEKDFNYQVEWDKQLYTITDSDLVRETQVMRLAHTTETVIVRSQPQSNGSPLTTFKPKSELEVLQVRETWAQIKSNNIQGWIPLQSLESKTADPGIAYVFTATDLREKPEANSKRLSLISRGTRFQDFTVKNNWLHINTEKQNGYIDIGHVYLRADFAQWAYHRTLGWIRIQHRENNQLRTQDNLLFPMTEFNSYVSYPHRAFVINSQNKGPQKRSRVEIKKLLADRWAVSRVKDHGEVWWKKESVALGKEMPSDLEVLSTQELLKRQVFSMAFTDSKKIQGLVSAKGIYKTMDGETWTKINHFGNNDYPVAVHSDGAWFIGAYRSLDAGKTFEPFIRWDKVADALAQKNITTGSQFKILKIETLKKPYIEILMDTGTRRVSLQTHILNQTWRTVK